LIEALALFTVWPIFKQSIHTAPARLASPDAEYRQTLVQRPILCKPGPGAYSRQRRQEVVLVVAPADHTSEHYCFSLLPSRMRHPAALPLLLQQIAQSCLQIGKFEVEAEVCKRVCTIRPNDLAGFQPASGLGKAQNAI